VFYKALGFAVWKLATAYVRRRYGRKLRIAAAVGVASIVAAGYLAARSSSS
jgi:hypothetical protein